MGQDVSPGKSVLLGTSKAIKKAMKLWDVSGDGEVSEGSVGCWALSKRVKEATHEVAALGALPLGFTVKLGLVRSICQLGCMVLRRRMYLPPLLALSGQL